MGERMERVCLEKEWENSWVSSGLESLQCSHKPGEIILNIKSFICRSRKVPEHLETSQATPGLKAALTSLLRAWKTVTMSPSPSFQRLEISWWTGKFPFEGEILQENSHFLCQALGLCVPRSILTSLHSDPSTALTTAKPPRIFPQFDIFVTPPSFFPRFFSPWGIKTLSLCFPSPPRERCTSLLLFSISTLCLA